MEANWSSYDKSPVSQKENSLPAGRGAKKPDDRGIVIGGDGSKSSIANFGLIGVIQSTRGIGRVLGRCPTARSPFAFVFAGCLLTFILCTSGRQERHKPRLALRRGRRDRRAATAPPACWQEARRPRQGGRLLGLLRGAARVLVSLLMALQFPYLLYYDLMRHTLLTIM